ncbi:DNA primase [Alteromonas sp. 5E99-2]|uniref:DNA primase n=1 Tax=Alteromonas sp. 5E99-2 TaxID=2817683 RepID=UPI001A996B8E|nr:DNA primase [Alteromonas sp. 5E99-2]MBO1254466.1 DNA primase [Alteromonas sp. 5E99-2]
MAGRIPRDFIDDLIARSDVVEVIDSRVKLKKAGKNYQACCPFHDEKSPSFTVSQEKQFYHCFGCGAHGNAISFLMEYDRLEFVEAVEELASILGLEVPREKGAAPAQLSATKNQRDSDYQLMEQVTKFFQHQLKNHAGGKAAIDYLKQRGLSGEIVKQWEIGYAPSEWDAVLSTFGRDNGLIQQLIDLKLITRNDNNKCFDFFRDRIMFPIRDKRGRVVGFGGRVMGDNGPKYLNSPETRLFHKGHELYGFYQARQLHRQLNSVLIVEGYMDVVALSQFGLTNATAALGTATTPEHLTMLMRSTKTIVCCYDGDRAGRDAAWRAVENALPILQDGAQLKFLFLPDGEDPDTMVRKEGQDAFNQRLTSAKPLSQFLFEHLLNIHSVGSSEGKAALKAQAMPMIEQIPGENQKSLMLETLSQHTGEFDRFKLTKDINQARHLASKPDVKNKFQQQKTRITPIRQLIHLLLEYPELAKDVPEVQPELLVDGGFNGLNLLMDIHAFCSSEGEITTLKMLDHFNQHPQISTINKLLLQETLISKSDAIQEYRDSFAKLLDWMVESRMEILIARDRVGGLSKDEMKELALLSQSRK